MAKHAALHRPLVHTERYCLELYDSARKRHARMDLVVFFGGQVYYLDVTCTHPFSGNGTCRVDGQVAKAAEKKHARYKTVVNGVRVTTASFVPVALSSYGAVGREARAFFGMLGRDSGESLDGERRATGRSLTALCAYLAVMYSAENVIAAFLSPSNVQRRGPAPVADAS